MKKETYDITGMSCAACSARIEKGISGMEGMQQCSVNLLKNSMTVSYDEAELDSGKIIHQVEDIGYGQLRFTRHRAAKRQEHQAEEKTVQQMRRGSSQSR